MSSLAELKAYAGIHHVFSASEGTAHTEHNIFIGTIVSTYSHGIGTGIVTVTGCKVPFVIRIKCQGVKSC